MSSLAAAPSDKQLALKLGLALGAAHSALEEASLLAGVRICANTTSPGFWCLAACMNAGICSLPGSALAAVESCAGRRASLPRVE